MRLIVLAAAIVTAAWVFSVATLRFPPQALLVKISAFI
jgi:hypothetical protein